MMISWSLHGRWGNRDTRINSGRDLVAIAALGGAAPFETVLNAAVHWDSGRVPELRWQAAQRYREGRNRAKIGEVTGPVLLRPGDRGFRRGLMSLLDVGGLVLLE